jgi:cytochrome c-type biogenesis protein CcmH
MSSREGTAPASAAAPAGPVDTSAPLPAGHPPLEGAPTAAPPLPSGHPPLGAPPAGARSAGNIAGTIALSPKLKVGPSDVLYVMAKKGAATLAVRRVDKPSFPFAFEISGGDAMTGGGAFEGTVDLVARVSRTGDAIPSKGDLEGTARGVKVPSKGVQLTIDTVRQ